jgi:hypothetical protein
MLVKRRDPIPGEGSRPGPAAAGWYAEPRSCCNCGREYTLWPKHAVSAREDARPPLAMTADW